MNPLTASLLHSLWQAGGIWIALTALLHLIPARAADARYRLTLLASSLVLLAWFATWFALASGAEPIAHDLTPSASMPHFRSGDFTSPSGNFAPTTTAHWPEPAQASWQRGLLVIWSLGVLIGFVRLTLSIACARRLVVDTTPVVEPALAGELSSICSAFGLKLTVQLRTCSRIATPAVVGILRPVILLPTSLLTGMPIVVVRAALAHEAAHLARWDLLVHLLQMGVEALLFFNPFVWLINNASRREREACCDAMASRYFGDPAGYSEALVWWSRLALGKAPVGGALGMAGEGDPRQGLRDRVLRLLQPARAPRSATGWLSAVGAACSVLLVLLTAGLSVEQGVAQLTDEQRVELIDHLAGGRFTAALGTAPNNRVATKLQRSFSGVVTDESGTPVVGAEWTMFSEIANDPKANDARVDGRSDAQGRFAGSIRDGTLRLRVRSPQFAQSGVTYSPAEPSENVRIVLRTGVELAVQCVDSAGEPVVGAEVGAEYPTWDRPQSRAASGADGMARLSHQPTGQRAKLQVSAAGYQEKIAENILVQSGGPAYRMVLKKALPVVVTVIDELDGSPVPGVVLRVQEMWPSPGPSIVWPKWNYLGLKTDGNGVAELEGLNPELQYGLLAQGQNRGVLFRVAPGREKTCLLRLPRERKVRLKILELPRNTPTPLHVQVSQMHSETGSSADFIKIPIVDGRAEADIGGLMPSRVSFHFLENWSHTLPLTAETTEVTIDYAAIQGPPKVKVVVQCVPTSGGALPRGSFFVNWALPGKQVWEGLTAPVHEGRSEFELPGTARFTLNNSQLLGGTVDEKVEYRAVENPTTLSVPVRPAGLIRVQVREPDGQLTHGLYITSFDPEKRGRGVEIKSSKSFPEKPQEWHLSDPVELGGGRYQVRAWAGNRVAQSEPFRVDAATPVQDVVLTLPAALQREVRVVDEAGAPLPGVRLQTTIAIEEDQVDGSTTQTDEAGIATLTLGQGVVPTISFRPLDEPYLPADQRPDFGKSSRPQIVLHRGHILSGRILDEATGAGVSGIQVSWMTDGSGGQPRLYSQGVSTDAAGRFQFSNAPATRVFLSFSYPLGKTARGGSKAHYVTAGTEEAVIYLQDTSR